MVYLTRRGRPAVGISCLLASVGWLNRQAVQNTWQRLGQYAQCLNQLSVGSSCIHERVLCICTGVYKVCDARMLPPAGSL